jgi:hypothetical protein
MPTFIDPENTTPLTPDEKKWCIALERLLLKTPKRFGIATVGDPDLTIFDRVACERLGIEQEECNPQNNGLGLAHISSSENIQGWCG